MRDAISNCTNSNISNRDTVLYVLYVYARVIYIYIIYYILQHYCAYSIVLSNKIFEVITFLYSLVLETCEVTLISCTPNASYTGGPVARGPVIPVCQWASGVSGDPESVYTGTSVRGPHTVLIYTIYTVRYTSDRIIASSHRCISYCMYRASDFKT